MSERDLVHRLLGTSGDDPGCDGAFALLAEYVEGELGDGDVEILLPGVAEHLRNCPACREDYEGVAALAAGRVAGDDPYAEQ
jgi:predicted anti-sigma-YlaC factor YlaD